MKCNWCCHEKVCAVKSLYMAAQEDYFSLLEKSQEDGSIFVPEFVIIPSEVGCKHYDARKSDFFNPKIWDVF